MKKALVAVASVFVLAMAAFLSISHAQTGGLAVIPEEPPQLQQLFKMVSHPSEIDEATKALDIPARLVNFHLATPADLSGFNIGIGKAVHIPVAIADREGGRKSLYYLDPGEEVLAGFFVTGDSIVLRYLKRETGVSVPAQTGDEYSVRLTNREGATLYEDRGTLTVVDPSKGVGEIKTQKSKTEVWVLWSCIRVRHESEK
jgi:hypothetical protein